jgi:bifunctional non-homologous end joining protein LigD
VRSCLIDGEAIVVDESGLSVFELLRYRHHDHAALLCAFDLIELDGNDLRRTPIEERKDFLAKLLNRPHEGIAFNQHYLCDGARRVVPDEERLSRLLRVILTDQDPQGRR